MVKNVDPVAPQVLKCLVLSTTQRYSVYCHRGAKKPENIHIEEAGIIKKLLKPVNH